MNYKKLYFDLIYNRRLNPTKGYTECHHILPKSLGGTNDKDNLVELTAREHFICHMLLTKMYPEGSVEWIKMVKAFMNMFRWNKDNQKRYCPSKWYEYCRINFSKAQSLSQSGSKNAHYGKCWIYNNELQQTKSINKSELQEWLNKGWQKGRKLKWDSPYFKEFGRNYYISSKRILELEQNSLIRQEKKKQNKELYTKYYEIYNTYGWEKFVEITGYSKSKANLVFRFQKYVDEYVPQNGKKRGT